MLAASGELVEVESVQDPPRRIRMLGLNLGIRRRVAQMEAESARREVQFVADDPATLSGLACEHRVETDEGVGIKGRFRCGHASPQHDASPVR